MTDFFAYEKPTPENIVKIDQVRAAFKRLFEEVSPILKDSRFKSLYNTNLEQSCMWAVKGLVFEDTK